MKTSVSETSIKTYHEIISDGTILCQRERVMNFMRERKIATRREIANALKIENGACAGRCNQLIKDRHLEKGVNVKCTITNKTVGTVILAYGQKELF